jgi:hypothetical protein
MKKYKIKNHRIKNLINTEIKKSQIRGDLTAINLLKYFGRKYY